MRLQQLASAVDDPLRMPLALLLMPLVLVIEHELLSVETITDLAFDAVFAANGCMRKLSRRYPPLPEATRLGWQCEGIIRGTGPGVPTPDGKDTCVLWCAAGTESGRAGKGAPFIIERKDLPPVLITLYNEEDWDRWSSEGGRWSDSRTVFRDGDVVCVSGSFELCPLPPEYGGTYRDAFPSLQAVTGRPYTISHGTAKQAMRTQMLSLACNGRRSEHVRASRC